MRRVYFYLFLVFITEVVIIVAAVEYNRLLPYVGIVNLAGTVYAFYALAKIPPQK